MKREDETDHPMYRNIVLQMPSENARPGDLVAAAVYYFLRENYFETVKQINGFESPEAAPRDFVLCKIKYSRLVEMTGAGFSSITDAIKRLDDEAVIDTYKQESTGEFAYTFTSKSWAVLCEEIASKGIEEGPGSGCAE